MDPLHHRVDALERQIHTLHQRSRAAERQLRWWRGLACGLLVGALLTWTLPSITAHEDARGGPQGLADRVAALETLLTPFSRVGNEVVMTGANLRLVNGLGSTTCTDAEGEPILDCPNGLGNLIVGYNERREFGANVRTGSHNVVVGPFHHFSRVGGVVVGDFNEISGDFAVVSGGQRNTASGDWSAVSGGVSNTASGGDAVVSGGFINTASGFATAVSGGASIRPVARSLPSAAGRATRPAMTSPPSVGDTTGRRPGSLTGSPGPSSKTSRCGSSDA